MKRLEYKWFALSCTSLGAFCSVLNSNALVIALPVIMKDLHASFALVIWTIMSYMLTITIFVPAIGRIADMVGRKWLFVAGFMVLTAGSFLCGLSKSGFQLLLFRIIQSIGGALLVSISTPIVTDAFEKKELGRALGINSMFINIAFVIGPIIGGFLMRFGWRSIFFINVPVGIIGTVWAWIQLKELDVLPEHQKFDWKGTIVFASGMLMFLFALTLGGLEGWANMRIVTMFLASIALLLLFVYIENKAEQPMLDLRLFKTRILAFAYGSNFFNGIARGSVTVLLVFYFQIIKGIDPFVAGILLAPFALVMMVVSPVSGWLSDKYGARELSSIGLLISGISLIGFMLITPSTRVHQLIIWMCIMGFGSGMFVSPNTACIMSAVPVERRGIAAGVRTMMNNAGNVISMGIALAIISSSINTEVLHGLFAGTQIGSKGIAVSEFISGLRTAFTISFVFSLLGACISYLRGPKPVWDRYPAG